MIRLHTQSQPSDREKFMPWLRSQLASKDFTLQVLPADAGFRQYYRLQHRGQTYIAVIAPPATENNAAFIAVSQAFAAYGVITPKVLAHDLTQGFLLLSDLGDAVLQHQLTPENAVSLYQPAWLALAKIQTCALDLPLFGRMQMAQELANFTEWFLKRHLQLTLSVAEQHLLQTTFDLLVDSATSQPQCCIHRDYHARNLMVLPQQQIGVLDFQDAMRGPITYDLVSLIRDCYIAWPAPQVDKWLSDFYHQHWQAVMPDAQQMRQWFDWMGIQRHLKAIFIFARKSERDHNARYLTDIPRTLNYIIAVSRDYPALRTFSDWLMTTIHPRLLA